jgi:hypothetical protein
MRAGLWIVFIGGGLLAWYWGGSSGTTGYCVAVFIALTFFRRPLVIALTHVASRFGETQRQVEKMPLAVRLVEAGGPDEKARPTLRSLAGQGFVDAGAWRIPEMPKIGVALMVHPQEGFLAAIESADPIGAQLNLHTLYPGGRVVTFTNSELPAPPAERPGTTQVRAPGSSPTSLLVRARRQRPQEGFSPMTVEEAPRTYEGLYAEEMLFRRGLSAS